MLSCATTGHATNNVPTASSNADRNCRRKVAIAIVQSPWGHSPAAPAIRNYSKKPGCSAWRWWVQFIFTRRPSGGKPIARKGRKPVVIIVFGGTLSPARFVCRRRIRSSLGRVAAVEMEKPTRYWPLGLVVSICLMDPKRTQALLEPPSGEREHGNTARADPKNQIVPHRWFEAWSSAKQPKVNGGDYHHE